MNTIHTIANAIAAPAIATATAVMGIVVARDVLRFIRHGLNPRPASAPARVRRPRPIAAGWRVHHAGRTYRGMAFRTLVRLVTRLLGWGYRPSDFRVYRRNVAGRLYRWSVRRFIATDPHAIAPFTFIRPRPTFRIDIP